MNAKIIQFNAKIVQKGFFFDKNSDNLLQIGGSKDTRSNTPH